MRLLGIACCMAIGYYIAKSGMDRELWETACELHDKWIRHVAGLARKELQ